MIEDNYNFKKIESKWQSKWIDKKVFECKTDPSLEKFYCLEMFPYPSGKIHMGHVRNYTIGDTIARFKKMAGFNVLHPVGWDAFGLPAENAAIERGVAPKSWTYQNIESMRDQLKKMGFSYDWTREIATCDQSYYKWGQWIFLKFFEKGLAFKKKALVNWCPDCNTVLANEQVDDGKCWRHGDTDVIEKDLEQWFFRITDFAEDLLAGHDQIKALWPERVLTMQKNWIGKSFGALIHFKNPDKGVNGGEDFPIFTTRPDTVFGVTFMAIAPEHPVITDLVKKNPQGDLSGFVEKIKKESRMERLLESGEKIGMDTGLKVINPFNGNEIPLWVGNFVLMDYGTGMIMSVPAHDQRDWEFAQKYGLHITPVIKPLDDDEGSIDEILKTRAFADEGVSMNSGQFDGLKSGETANKIIEKIEKEGFGKKEIQYRLKDWLISRQRYWGNPIPIVYCDKCGTVPVPFDDLPVVLPEKVDMRVKGKSPLENEPDFLNCHCPKCKGKAKRETDTMDTFVDSSWYFLRYLTPDGTELPVNKKDSAYWMGVDQYIGGIEHAVMHLLYARFFNMVLYDLGISTQKEPFGRLLTQGMVVNNSYYDPKNKKYFYKNDLGGNEETSPLDPSVKLTVRLDKMSKSKNNGVDPSEMLSLYGADTIRLFSLFASPPERDLEWSEQGIEGCFRFINRVYKIAFSILSATKEIPITELPQDLENIDEALIKDIENDIEAKKLFIELNRTIKKISEDIGERLHLNTAVASVMEFSNNLTSSWNGWAGKNDFGKNNLRGKIVKLALVQFAKLLSPMAPHLAEEIYFHCGLEGLISESSWPKYNPQFAVFDEIEIVFQINGKVRSKEKVSRSISREEMEALCLKDEKIKANTNGKNITKVIIVPGKLVNVVVK